MEDLWRRNNMVDFHQDFHRDVQQDVYQDAYNTDISRKTRGTTSFLSNESDVWGVVRTKTLMLILVD